ncbi:hypothetical protein AVEN_201688-1 [Araneus ventricosus]|uniref:Uncharacterized protein n=1 Tax=Araneus ventricosus TaxID=182803 RepID=A0A4Y2F8K7_ARAVE|nr:hypothetical protein AVEN_201688-1 [Araneus ventricosus]
MEGDIRSFDTLQAPSESLEFFLQEAPCCDVNLILRLNFTFDGYEEKSSIFELVGSVHWQDCLIQLANWAVAQCCLIHWANWAVARAVLSIGLQPRLSYPLG